MTDSHQRSKLKQSHLGSSIERRKSAKGYAPNHIPFATRWFSALISLTWVGWALIGLMSGHMFFLISKKGPAHFSGIPAFLFCAAVLISAAACSISIIDHYDKRNNEAVYQSVRRGFWWSAALIFGAALLVGLLERSGNLPWTDGHLGWLSLQSLRNPSFVQKLTYALAPHELVFKKWSDAAGLFCLALGLVMKLAQVEPGEASPLWGALVLFSIGLAATLFCLYLLASHASWTDTSAPFLSRRQGMLQPTGEESMRYQLAWIYSMLIACAGVAALTISALLFCLLSRFGYIDSVSHLSK